MTTMPSTLTVPFAWRLLQDDQSSRCGGYGQGTECQLSALKDFKVQIQDCNCMQLFQRTVSNSGCKHVAVAYQITECNVLDPKTLL